VNVARTEAVLEATAITCRFGGLQALDGVSLSARAREIVGVVGPNGAGKTTMLNLLSGVIRPTSGTIRFRSHDVTNWPAHRIAAAGLRRTFQNIRLFADMDVMENVLVGLHLSLRGWLIGGILPTPQRRAAERAAVELAHEALAAVGLADDLSRRAGSLSYGEQRRLELARALAPKPGLLLLDEPGSGLNTAEKSEMAALIDSLPARFGVAVVLVEHDIEMVTATCSQVTVLDYGKVIATGGAAAVFKNPDVVEAFLGPDE
jgi:ABC-type branched-subunit amino acid transport system ATPase component